jgi:hypothetical protein
MLISDPDFAFIFGDDNGFLMHPDNLESRYPYLNLAQVHRAFQVICLELSAMASQSKEFAGVQFGFRDASGFNARVYQFGEAHYTIVFNLGMVERLLALFRQLALTNAFGNYSQERSFSKTTLEAIHAIPDISGMRAKEKSFPIDALLKLPGTEPVSMEDLHRVNLQAPVDQKHLFDIQSLLFPALTFAFWHEVAHLLYGHVDWVQGHTKQLGLNENTSVFEGRRKIKDDQKRWQRGLEVLADIFAARRIGLDILRSAHIEKENYAIGPFRFNRENFNTFGQLEGLPGEEIAFNLEGFLYRINFAISGLTFLFSGFAESTYKDQWAIHPHPDVRDSYILDIMINILRGGAIGRFDTYIANLYSNQFGYAIQTMEIAMLACGASHTPIRQNSVMGVGMFHNLEVQAKTKRAGEEADRVQKKMAAYQYEGMLRFLEPQRGFTLPLKPSSENTLLFDVAA